MKGGNIASSILLVLTVAVHLMAEPDNNASITCTDVVVAIGPCVSYLTGQQPKPADQCCAGVQKLKETVTATVDKRFACQCMKTAAEHFRDVLKNDRVSALPTQCGAPLPFPISLNYDCSRLN